MMKTVSTAFVAVLLLTVAYGGGAAESETEHDWAELALSSEVLSDVRDVAPGAYSGPSTVTIPDGWKSWSDDVHQQCGPLKLVFLNPDLQEDPDDNMVHASGSFFIQFQAVGDIADQITRFSFSFGKTDDLLNENDVLNCDESLPETALGQGTGGAYLLFYRSDFNKDDGFFVPIETRNVPDGEYGAAVHAYTGNGLTGYTEVARAWAKAVVKNCDGPSYPNGCLGGAQEAPKNDKTMPWPMVLPGDGEQTNSDVDGITIEVLDSMGVGSTPDEMAQDAIDGGRVKLKINNEEKPLEPWTPPARDRDVIPLNDQDGCPGGQNVRSVCEKVIYSTGFKWEGQVQCDDIIHVTTQDMNGNEISKQIHNCRTSGGATTDEVAIVDFKVTSDDSMTVQAGETIRYTMRLENVGGGDAHVNLLLDYNESIMDVQWSNVANEHDDHAEGTAEYEETHVHMDPGMVSNLDVVVRALKDTPKGEYPVRAGLEYNSAGEYYEAWRDLFTTVESAVEQTNETDENETDDKPVVKDSPAPTAFVLTGVLGLVAVALRRRRL